LLTINQSSLWRPKVDIFGKAIAIENLKKLKKGKRGDGKAKLRKILYHWNVKKFLQKLKRVATIKGVEVIEVNPAYTSVIGMLKYAPQVSIDKDIAGAYVIGRRALGFKEDTPENYEKLLKHKAYVEGAWNRVRSRLVPLEAGGTVLMKDF